MRDYYKLTFPITSSVRKTTQKLLLIGAIVVDIGNFFVLIDCIFGSLYYLILLFGMIVLSTVMRVISLYCNYTYLYLFNSGTFMIYKSYSLKSCAILQIDKASQYELLKENSQNVKAQKLYNVSCQIDKYLLTIEGNHYEVALDAYMCALINTQIGKENCYDIS